MSYDDLEDRLESLADGDALGMVALPDGSVDRCYGVSGLEGETLPTREAFARQLRDGEGDTFPLERLEIRPGGQAVNAARQLDRLGERVTLVATLEHPVFEDLAMETRSTGEPARIEVLAFDGEEVLLPKRAPEADGWGLDDLAAAIDLERLRAADGLCCTNWVTYRGLEEVFDHLAATPGERDDVPLVCDPGAIGGVAAPARRDLLESLAAAGSSRETVLSVNREELEAAADALERDDGTDLEDANFGNGDLEGDDLASLAAVRRASGLDAVVLHASDGAAAATDDGLERAPMLAVDDPRTTTGAGDRFSAGLACGLARGWPWATALALGNACAARFVATGETGGPARLRSFVESHEKRS